ncbi:MAG: rRNA maturation RNase YbeY [Planctomycetes bacterium]|nr:rRNA maturation RNase YbeY [Planctomycetota bacterium]
MSASVRNSPDVRSETMEDESPYDISVALEDGLGPLPASRLVEAIGATLRRHGAPSARVSVAIVGDERIAEINRTHLRHAGPTDAVTFDLRDRPGDPIDGEIVISAETAAREAHRRGHPMDAELMLYAVHGALHLLGFDDASDEEAARMHAMEDEILVDLGVGPVYNGGAR